jgi:DNA-directed RNA polymerase subunit RPC12/RpoP
MAITFDCPTCGRTIRVRDDAAGRSGVCPDCKSKINVPTATQPPKLPPRATRQARHEPPEVEVSIDDLREAQRRRIRPRRSVGKILLVTVGVLAIALLCALIVDVKRVPEHWQLLASATGVIGVLLALLVPVTIYCLPAIVAARRRHHNRLAIDVLDLLSGGPAAVALLLVGNSSANEIRIGPIDSVVIFTLFGLTGLLWLVALVWSCTAVRNQDTQAVSPQKEAK